MKDLIKVARKLESLGLTKESSALGAIIRKISADRVKNLEEFDDGNVESSGKLKLNTYETYPGQKPFLYDDYPSVYSGDDGIKYDQSGNVLGLKDPKNYLAPTRSSDPDKGELDTERSRELEYIRNLEAQLDHYSPETAQKLRFMRYGFPSKT